MVDVKRYTRGHGWWVERGSVGMRIPRIMEEVDGMGCKASEWGQQT